MSQKTPLVVSCPACEAEIRFRKAPYVGQYKICPECDTELEVVSLSPIEVDYLEDVLDSYDDTSDTFADFDEEDEYADYALPEIEPERRPIPQNSLGFDD